MIHYFTDNWENIQNFQARPEDILIATYPKAGTTWVSYILDLLYFANTAPERQASLPIYLRVPFLEATFPETPSGVELADKLPTTPRLIKTHLPVQLVPKSFWEQNCKVVYVARNAKDNAVSYYHFDKMNMVAPEPGDWNIYVQKFMDGKTMFGPWYDHVCGYWEKKQTYSNIHYMFYEDMVEDTGREVERLCSFLGLSTPIEERERITNGVQFDAMKQNNMTNYSTVPAMDFKVSPFMRKDSNFFMPYMQSYSRVELIDFEGVPLVHFITDNWEKIKNFKARPDDILIATYPKAGTTWVSYILDLLYFGNTSPERQTSLPIYLRVPFLEANLPEMPSGVELADELATTPRLIKTHLPIQLVPKSFWEQNCRVVYVARNAKDNAVSYYHFDRMNMIAVEPGDWNTYLQRFMDGRTMYGPWYDHVCGYWEKKQTYSNLHYMFFEDMVEDTGREVEHLCSFLGLSISTEERKRITKGVHFDAMKQNKMTNYSTVPVMDSKISPFMRKGKVGDWKNHFTVAQNEQFDKHYKEKMKSTTLQFRTQI
ncbi:hypothetical protein MHYP_G00352010 [Metynnis hypsauchen]